MMDFYRYYSMYEYKHGCRVADISEIIAVNMGVLTQEDLSILQLAALNHDVGKSSIPRSIINKNGKLTAEEWDYIKLHPVLGCLDVLEITKSIRCAEVVKSHHEYWNGKGYPEGLAGNEIPVESRIISIADALDALVNDRPYREAHTFEEAVRIIKDEVGTKFDPNVYKAFKRALNDIEEYIVNDLNFKGQLRRDLNTCEVIK